MYYTIILYALCLFGTHAAVIPSEAEAKIVKYESTNDGAGSYKFSFETSNGIMREEIGYLVNVGTKDEHMMVLGSYSYTDVDGKVISVNYVADEEGYRIIPKSKSKSVTRIEPKIIASLLGK